MFAHRLAPADLMHIDMLQHKFDVLISLLRSSEEYQGLSRGLQETDTLVEFDSSGMRSTRIIKVLSGKAGGTEVIGNTALAYQMRAVVQAIRLSPEATILQTSVYTAAALYMIVTNDLMDIIYGVLINSRKNMVTRIELFHEYENRGMIQSVHYYSKGKYVGDTPPG